MDGFMPCMVYRQSGSSKPAKRRVCDSRKLAGSLALLLKLYRRHKKAQSSFVRHYGRLNSRCEEVLRQLAMERNREIAERLVISLATVNKHAEHQQT
jgi:DNA-binding NarL/FixJ family response regulator